MTPFYLPWLTLLLVQENCLLRFHVEHALERLSLDLVLHIHQVCPSVTSSDLLLKRFAELNVDLFNFSK